LDIGLIIIFVVIFWRASQYSSDRICSDWYWNFFTYMLMLVRS